MLIRTRPTGSSQSRIASRVIIMVIEGKAIKNRNDHQRLNTMLDCAPGKCRPSASSSFSQKQKVKPLGKMTRVGGFPAGKVECTHWQADWLSGGEDKLYRGGSLCIMNIYEFALQLLRTIIMCTCVVNLYSFELNNSWVVLQDLWMMFLFSFIVELFNFMSTF